ncbi:MULTISPECIES: hypothetical protein [Lactococcus]|uniref:hypothetical protein n=1 Tax=Lactococcus TaxID=1357 RepID=UPI0010BED6CE|nr:hypothetical protein [Lactococcus lactis]MDS1011949.1 hypothetical protein [Lactococcus lactis]TKD77240.1 hypothetical protein E6O52_10100 [Lactococcus lactis]UXV67639.1 hypothetical protein LLUL021_09250 [Lactococcus lactis subsp. lactis]
MVKEFKISQENYLENIIKYIQERLESAIVQDCIDIIYGVRNGETVVTSVTLKIIDKSFKNYGDSNYVIKIQETTIPKTQNSIITNKYSYEIRNTTDPSDFVRFDYKPYKDFPHFHINSDEEKWGNHLTYPDSTNIDLERLDCFKAINIFNSFVAHPDEHILDKTKNERYLKYL